MFIFSTSHCDAFLLEWQQRSDREYREKVVYPPNWLIERSSSHPPHTSNSNSAYIVVPVTRLSVVKGDKSLIDPSPRKLDRNWGNCKQRSARIYATSSIRSMISRTLSTEQKSGNITQFVGGTWVVDGPTDVRMYSYSADPSVNPPRYSSIAALRDVHESDGYLGEVMSSSKNTPSGAEGNIVYLWAPSLRSCSPVRHV
ncbi:hypothetical protein EDD85DRAFT_939489 [Armillaria nabsnona]|nr:hypothetical protein EDD85DRAFT_939489 [Armillaria nabsnona]